MLGLIIHLHNGPMLHPTPCTASTLRIESHQIECYLHGVLAAIRSAASCSVSAQGRPAQLSKFMSEKRERVMLGFSLGNMNWFAGMAMHTWQCISGNAHLAMSAESWAGWQHWLPALLHPGPPLLHTQSHRT